MMTAEVIFREGTCLLTMLYANHWTILYIVCSVIAKGGRKSCQTRDFPQILTTIQQPDFPEMMLRSDIPSRPIGALCTVQGGLRPFIHGRP